MSNDITTDSVENLLKKENIAEHLWRHPIHECWMHEWQDKTIRDRGVERMLVLYGDEYARAWRRLLPTDRRRVLTCKPCASYIAACVLDPSAADSVDPEIVERLEKLMPRLGRVLRKKLTKRS